MKWFPASPAVFERLAPHVRSSRFLFSCFLLCALLFSNAEQALAEDAKVQARSLFGEGVVAFDRGDFENALESFTQAYRLAPHPAVRVNMANCYEQLGRYAEAAFNYQRFLEESGPNVDPAQRKEVEEAIERMRRKFGTIIVETDPSDVSLSVDGSSAPRGPDGRMQVRAGSHLLRATKPGYQSVEQTVNVEGGAEQRVLLRLQAVPAEPPVAPELGTEQAENSFGPDNATRIERDSRGLRSTMWIVFGTSALLGIGAGITGGLALKAQTDFDDAVTRSNAADASAPERAQARADGLNASDRADTLAMVTDVLAVGALVGFSSAFVLWLMDRKRSNRERGPSVAIAPASSGQNGAQLFLRGVF